MSILKILCDPDLTGKEAADWENAYDAITKLAVISPHEQFEAYCAANNLEYHYNRPTQSIYIRLKPLSATRNFS